jgi:hypothetical protein
MASSIMAKRPLASWGADKRAADTVLLRRLGVDIPVTVVPNPKYGDMDRCARRVNDLGQRSRAAAVVRATGLSIHVWSTSSPLHAISSARSGAILTEGQVIRWPG